MYFSFNEESFKAAVAKTLADNNVDRLVHPKNSEFYYLKELSFADIAFAEQYSYKYTTVVNYKVDVTYKSRRDNGQRKTSSYTSYTVGARFEESDGVDKIPKKIYEAHKPKLAEGQAMLEEVDDYILRTAKTKIKAKVRRAGDMIEREDMDEAVFAERSERSSGEPAEYLIWSPLVNKNTKKRIGYGVVTNRGVEYVFSPDKTKEGLDKTLKPLPQPKAAPAPKAAAPAPKKKKKPRRSLGDRISSLIAQGIIATIVAAILLVVELVVIFFIGIFSSGSIVGKGYVLKNSPGVYRIDAENYSDYIMISTLENGSERYSLKEGEQCTYIGRSESSSMQDYAIFQVIPRTAAYSLFDLSEKKSLLSVGEYTTSSLFNLTAPKYVVTDLTVKFEITYSYQGTEYTIPAEFYADTYGGFYETATVRVDFPDEIMTSHTGEYVTDMKGNTVTRTIYWADVDYWSFRITEVSGFAEVEEVSR